MSSLWNPLWNRPRGFISHSTWTDNTGLKFALIRKHALYLCWTATHPFEVTTYWRKSLTLFLPSSHKFLSTLAIWKPSPVQRPLRCRGAREYHKSLLSLMQESWLCCWSKLTWRRVWVVASLSLLVCFRRHPSNWPLNYSSPSLCNLVSSSQPLQ